MNVAQHINHSYKTGNKTELLKVKSTLTTNLKELDVFFEEYLELFDDQMNTTTDKNAPVWKAYNDHYKAYENLKHNIKMTDYYLGML
jgi:hypothetical protein